MAILYTTPQSANGRKASAAARHLMLDVEVRTIDVYRGEGQSEGYKAVNPWGKIPTFTDGDFVVWESNAILMHFAELAGTNELFASEPRARAQIVKWLFWESSHWQPTVSRVLAPRAAQVLFRGAEPAVSPDWDDAELARALAFLESELAARDYLAGARLSIADLSVAGMTTYFRAARFPAERYPAISTWMQRLEALPAWASTLVDPWI